MKSIISIGMALTFAISLCAPVSAKTTLPKNTMENQKRMARVWFEEAFVKENLGPLDEILAEDVVMNMDPSYPSKVNNSTQLKGREQVKQHVKNFTGVAETSGTIRSLVGEGDTVVLFRDVTVKLPDGTAKDVPWVTLFKFKNGKISEITHVHDTHHEAKQLGSATK